MQSLNPEQQKAVTHTYGPLMVLAGPGTGKTQVLTARITHLLKLDLGITPDNILCLTFTESGASNMKERLQSLIGPDAYRVHISTFHGFCEKVLSDYSHYFLEQKQARTPGEEIDKALALRKTLQGIKDLDYFKPYWDEYFYQSAILGAISHLKREHLSPERFKALIPQEKERLMADPDNFYKRAYQGYKAGDFKPPKKNQIEEKVCKMEELARVWEAYEVELQKAGFYDFDDQINWVVDRLQHNPDLRFDLQERFQWILVDEYQDTNDAQNEILWQLCEGVEDPNLFVVGDDDQSIYRFQGASVANMMAFETRFPTAQRITLRENYRSTQTVLDAAFAVINHNTQRIDPEKKLVANTDLNFQLKALNPASPLAEIQHIVQAIKATNIPLSQIAILTRTNREIHDFLHHLPRYGIPVEAHISDDLFTYPTVAQLILMIRILGDFSSDHDLIELLHAPFLNISAGDLMRFSLHRNHQKKTILELLDQKDWGEVKNPESFAAFYQFFIEARKDYFHLRPAVLAEKLLYESGLAEYVGSEDWHYLTAFIDWIRNQNIRETKALIEKIDLHQTLGLRVSPPPLTTGEEAVQLMTAHRSKGLEFEMVFIPRLWDGKWGNNKSRDMIPLPQLSTINYRLSNEDLSVDPSINCLEDERRLFFVALTRAKSQLYLSIPQEDLSGREKNPSQFFHEIPDELINRSIDQPNNYQLPTKDSFIDQSISRSDDLLKSRVATFVWSASSLQAYLDHPRRFLYQNLLKYPRRPLSHLALGVALHQALEQYFRTPNQEGKEALLDHFQYALKGQNIPRASYESLERTGMQILNTYFDQKLSEPNTQKQELEFDFGKLTPHLDDIRLTGKVDKLVYLDDQKSTAKIVDYKSGKPKSIRTGESLWRQLVFYDLLAKNAPGFKARITHTELEFLTPNPKGEIETKVYEVTSEDREAVEKELRWADEQIRNLQFPMVENPEKDPEIEYWNRFGSF